MELTSPIHRRYLALAVCVVGVLVAWFALEPAGLLVVVAVICIWLGAGIGVVAIAATGVLWLGVLLLQPPLGSDDVLQLAVFVGSAVAIWLVVQVFRAVSLTNVLDQGSRLVTDIPGLGWYAYPDGRLRFINPAVLDFVGVTADELRRMMETEANPLDRWTHPDERERNQANWDRARARGEAYIDESRALRHDGEWRWLRDSVTCRSTRAFNGSRARRRCSRWARPPCSRRSRTTCPASITCST